MRVMQRVKKNKTKKTSCYSRSDNLKCEDGSLTVLGGGLDTTTFWQRIILLNAISNSCITISSVRFCH